MVQIRQSLGIIHVGTMVVSVGIHTVVTGDFYYQ